MQIINFLKTNWHVWLPILIVIGLALLAYLDWQFSRLELFGPRDIVGNGITVGRAKAFDNRSLSLRIERLSNSLAQMKVVDQKFTDNLGKIQAQSSSLSSQTLTLDVKGEIKPAAPAAPNPAEKPATPAAAGTAGKVVASDDANKTEPKSEVALAAGDILNEQLNLASQILNLQTLYERSLTDRLIKGHARLQTVLGFQVSITPPKGFENCVAIVEVAVRVKSKTDAQEPVSLVAMIPQEKTYNAQSVSTNAQSIGGSAVASVMNVGYTNKGESRQLFIHRDSDTVAFERNPKNSPALFADDSATVFGWEFRPVLGRETVSPGVRQMLAVLALPVPDKSEDKETKKQAESVVLQIETPTSEDKASEEQAEPVVLQIKTRSYWRRYDSKRQTSALKWHWWPWAIDGSANVQSETQELTIPDTKKIQKELMPKVTNISWVNSGFDRATVIVKGENFFPGTKVVTAGKVHREEDGTLTLKSDQALEFETTLAAIASGDSVLSGRFGSSLQLNVNKERLPVRSLYITRAAIKASRRGKDLRISIDVKGLDDEGSDHDLEVDHLNNLPEPILFVGNEAVPMPYDYWQLTPAEGAAKGETAQTTAPATRSSTDPTSVAQIPPAPPASGSGADSGGGTRSAGEPFNFSKSSSKKSIRIEAWIPPRIAVTKNSSVMFRVPFCGLDYQAFQPLRFFEPTVTRMGTDATNGIFRISHSLGSSKAVTVELDKVYDKNSTELVKVIESDGDYRFTVPKALVSQYQHLVVRIEGAEPFVVPVPPEDKPKPKPTLDLNVKPPQITKDSIGPAEWTGTNLEMLTAAWLLTTPVPIAGSSGAAAAPTRTSVVFTVYDGGKKFGVYFPASATGVVGKAEVEFQIGSNAADTIKAPLLIAEKAAPSFSAIP